VSKTALAVKVLAALPLYALIIDYEVGAINVPFTGNITPVGGGDEAGCTRTRTLRPSTAMISRSP
jgi:hypothetical protein